jgi:1-deoxy-D-xylulose-5-phosphate synthase
VPAKPKVKKYSDVFGEWLCETAEKDPRLVAITPAMCEGSGMVEFARRFPDRFYDVAIAEQHAVTLAAGLACEGLKPVVAIYSTFLQRGYDQLIHDVALQNLDVTFAIDRAGLVGEDGPTHHGVFDLSYLRCIPNMAIAAPASAPECRRLLSAAFEMEGPTAVRYPRGSAIEETFTSIEEHSRFVSARTVRQGNRVAILNFGALLPAAIEAAESIDASVIDMRWAKPLDTDFVASIASKYELLVSIEDNVVTGGAGSGVGEIMSTLGTSIGLLSLGLSDQFTQHGSQQSLRHDSGLDAEGIVAAIATVTDDQLTMPTSELHKISTPLQ